MLSQPSFYDGARPNPETERRAPEMGQSRQARLGCKRKSSGSIMAPIAADSQVCCSLWSVLLLVSTFWPKPDVPCAEQQAPLQFLVVQMSSRASKRKQGLPAEHGLLPLSPRGRGKKPKGDSTKKGKAASVAATGGVQFGTPFGRAHFASVKAPGLQLTDVQMIDPLWTGSERKKEGKDFKREIISITLANSGRVQIRTREP